MWDNVGYPHHHFLHNVKYVYTKCHLVIIRSISLFYDHFITTKSSAKFLFLPEYLYSIWAVHVYFLQHVASIIYRKNKNLSHLQNKKNNAYKHVPISLRTKITNKLKISTSAMAAFQNSSRTREYRYTIRM